MLFPQGIQSQGFLIVYYVLSGSGKGSPSDTTPSILVFSKLGVLKVQDVFKLQVSKFIFNCLQLNTPTIFHNWFRLNYTIHNYNTRSTFFDIDDAINSNNLFIINARTTHYGLKLLKVSGPKIWNLIPNRIRSTRFWCVLLNDISKNIC